MKLVDWAKKQGIAYMTAWKWFKAGKLPVPAYKTPSGAILVQEETPPPALKTYCYCRVSTYEKKDDLERQAQRCTDFCLTNGWAVDKVVKEIASGMNDKRPKLMFLLKTLKRDPARIIVEYKDRLTRFGFNYIETFMNLLQCELIVMNRQAEEKNDLMQDLVSVITSFCCRLYGMRKGHNKAKEVKSLIDVQN